MPTPLVAEHTAGLCLLRSPLLLELGVPHAFTTRLGGVSTGSFASLNLGRLTGDAPAAVSENRRRLCAALGFELGGLRSVHQVHGCGVAPAELAAAGDVEESEAYHADSLVGSDASQLLGVRVADCLPILLVTDDGRHVAAVHGGWRGLAAGIVGKAVDALAAQAEVSPERVLAAVGPGIGAEAYIVGADVAGQFDTACSQTAGPGQFHLDLRKAAGMDLVRAGVTRFELADHCTVAQPEWFYSHRRDGAATGRQMAVIAPLPGVG